MEKVSALRQPRSAKPMGAIVIEKGLKSRNTVLPQIASDKRHKNTNGKDAWLRQRAGIRHFIAAMRRAATATFVRERPTK